MLTANKSQLIAIENLKLASHLLITYHDNGTANTKAISDSHTYCLLSRLKMEDIPAPNTFLIPISFVRFTALMPANPNKPMQEIKIANPVANPVTLIHRS